MASPNAARAMQVLVQLGYSPVQAAGIVGNLIQESGASLNPTAVGDQGTAFGIAQWRGPRFAALKQFAGNEDWRNLDTQLRFLDHELKTQETSAYSALRNAQNVDQATAAFIGFERPRGWSAGNPRGGHGWDRRLANARTLEEYPSSTAGMGLQTLEEYPSQTAGAGAYQPMGMPAAPQTPRERLMAFGQDVAKGAGETFKAMGIPPANAPPPPGTLPAMPVVESKAAPMVAETATPPEVRKLDVAAPMASTGWGGRWVWENGRLVHVPDDRRGQMARALGG